MITTIQRHYSMLKGEPALPADVEEESHFDEVDVGPTEPLPVVYDAAIPPESFDIIFIDECHRSIYTLWRQVLEYFDAYLVGLTATPAKHTFGFFNQNLVMEYPHEQADADGVNCAFEIYTTRTRISQASLTFVAGEGVTVGKRDRETQMVRWEKPDADLSYQAPSDEPAEVPLARIGEARSGAAEVTAPAKPLRHRGAKSQGPAIGRAGRRDQ